MSLLNDVLESKQEAHVLIQSLEALANHAAVLLGQEEPSLESVQLVETAIDGFMLNLGERYRPSLESESIADRLKVTIESVEETVQKLKDVMPKLDNEARSDCKQFKDKVEKYSDTYLKEEWWEDKDVEYDRVELDEHAVSFTREGKIVEGVVSDVREEHESYKQHLDDINVATVDFEKAAVEACNDALEKEDDEFVSAIETLLSGENPIPYDKWKGADHNWMGANDKGEPADPEKFDERELPALGRDGVKEMASLAVDLADLYCDVNDKALSFPSEEFSDAVKKVGVRLKPLNANLHGKFMAAYSPEVVNVQLTAPYAQMSHLLKALLEGIDEYLDESVTEKKEDESEEEGKETGDEEQKEEETGKGSEEEEESGSEEGEEEEETTP